MIQIRSFIEKLGLRSKHSTLEQNEWGMKNGADIKKTDLPNTSIKSDKKRTKQEKARSELTSDGGANFIHLDKNLLTLSAKAYKKLLVSMDSDQLLFEQVNVSSFQVCL